MLKKSLTWPPPAVLVLSLIVGASLLINLTSFRPGHDWGGDQVWYLAQARAIVTGTMERIAEQGAFRNENVQGYQPGPNIYPWGFPFLLAPVHDLPLNAIKASLLLFYAAGLCLLYALMRGQSYRLIVIATVALSPWLFEFKNVATPAGPFFAASMLGLLAIQRLVIERRSQPQTMDGVIVGITLFAAYWLKSQGLVLLATLVLVHLWTRPQWRDVIPYMVFGAGVVLVTFLPGSASYAGSGHFEYAGIKDLLVVSLRHVVSYMRYVPEFITGIWPKPAILPVGAVLFLLAAVGVFQRWRHDFLYVAFVAVNFALLIPYRWAQPRFVLIVLPFILYFALHGAAKFRIGRYVGAVILGVAAITTVVSWVGVQRHNPIIEGPLTREAQETFAYIRQNTPPDAVFAFFKPRILTVETGRPAYFRYKDPLRGVDFALVYNHQGKDSRNSLLRNALRTEAIWQNDKFSLHRVSMAAPRPETAIPRHPQ